jgi:hypothetical protein
MPETVWCVFQKLPGDSCPTLSAICGSERAAQAMVEMNQREQREMGEAEGEWTFSRWSVFDQEVGQLESADQISHVLGPMRGAIAIPPDEMEEQSREDSRSELP